MAHGGCGHMRGSGRTTYEALEENITESIGLPRKCVLSPCYKFFIREYIMRLSARS
jgi:hypothetical protein